LTTLPTPTNAVDLQGLDQLRRRAARDDPTALAEAAVQFEALFIGMMLDSARSASLGDGLFDGPQTEQYLELMDRQVALDLARGGGFGFGRMLLEQLGARTEPPQPAKMTASFVPPAARTVEPAAPAPITAAPLTPDEFVAQLLPDATTAAAALGIEPRLLLAQAALETGWGVATPQRPDGESANNLFGIKAGASWRGARVAHFTLEHDQGVTARRREEFRAYASPAASFADYVDLIGGSARYAGALANAHDPEAYARGVTAAGYATDPAYADKWLAIYHGERLGDALRKIDSVAPQSTGPVAKSATDGPLQL